MSNRVKWEVKYVQKWHSPPSLLQSIRHGRACESKEKSLLLAKPILLLSYSSKIFEYKDKFCSAILFWILIFELHCTVCHLTSSTIVRFLQLIVLKIQSLWLEFCCKHSTAVSTERQFSRISPNESAIQECFNKKPSSWSVTISTKNTQGGICAFF